MCLVQYGLSASEQPSWTSLCRHLNQEIPGVDTSEAILPSFKNKVNFRGAHSQPSLALAVVQSHHPADDAAHVAAAASRPRATRTVPRIWKASSASIFMSFRCLLW